MNRTAIIGGGITGLTAALKLQEAGFEVVLFERRARPGGSVKSVGEKTWRVEYGPNTLQLKSAVVFDFLEELGLENELVEANPEASKRYIVRGGKLIQVPAGLSDGLTTPLFSPGGKLRLLAEPFRSRSGDPDETVASFVRRRVGREFLDYAVDPFIAGIYAGRPDQLSVRHAFPRLYNLEHRYGSLTAGMVAKAWERWGQEKFKTRLVSFQNGLQELTDRIADRLTDLRCGHDVSRIQKSEAGWEIHVEGERYGGFDKLLLNIPLYRINEQLIDGGGAVLNIEKTAGYPPLSIIFTGYRRDQVEHPLDGFGFLVPEKENRRILGSLFSSTLFPGRASPDHVLITTFIGGMRQPELAALETGELIQLVAGEHRELLGLSGEPLFVDHVYWPKSIPQYCPEYDRVLDVISTLEKDNEGLHLIGNFRGGISVPDCIENGILRAEQIVESAGV